MDNILTKEEKINIINTRINILNIEIEAINKSLKVYYEENLDEKIEIFLKILDNFKLKKDALISLKDDLQ